MGNYSVSAVEAAQALPKGPVFGWSSFQLTDAPGIPSVEDLPHIAFTTSGRSAIYQVLLQLQLPPHSAVLVPTYHCPTMVAPVILADHQPVYFGIRADGLPDLLSIDLAMAQPARAMIVSHYFGLAQSLHEVREWCDSHGIALIEDCAHCYFGQAGERPIGAWGDYCTASLSKFFPVPEAGLLGSAHHTINTLQLTRQGIKAEIKGWVDVIETATRHRRLKGLNQIFASIFRLKRGEQENVTSQAAALSAPEATMMEGCNMARIRQRPLATSMLLRRVLPRGRIIAQRQRNFSIYSQLLSDLTGTKPLVALPTKPVAPYVFPLWVDDADRVYHALRAQGIPVFRWDQIWPGTPTLPHDAGLDWSHHVLQLLCHQDLCEDDIRRSAQCLQTLLKSARFAPNHSTTKYKAQPCLL
ncbi:MAG: DegT/DnrJ/EryC1/StrS family aminotransferase [Rhodoferax sp.]